MKELLRFSLLALALVLLTLLATPLLQGCTTIPLDTFEPSPTAATRIVSFNVRFDDIAEPASRVLAIVRAIGRMDADIVCLQEAYSVDGFELLDHGRLANFLRAQLPEYVLLSPEGVAKWASGTPILYRRERFFAVEQGVRWFSAEPDIPDSRSFGNTIPRNMSWARLYDARGNTHFLVVNLHLDPGAVGMNQRAAEELHAFTRAHSTTPHVLCGDWNSLPYSDVLARFSDTHRRAAAARSAPTFTRLPIQIDHILASNDFTILNAGVLDPGEGLSDHRPIFADLVLAGVPDPR
jgi:endonuclease/exonuclease/phosphatase family metal-dependent hydrolase